jgi:hypothetical protein
MEGLTRLVDESMARHGFDRSLDYRRLHWSRWFRCDSPHSLLFVPSKPGVFAIAEEVAAFCGASEPPPSAHGGADAPVRLAEQSPAAASSATTLGESTIREGRDFSRAENAVSSLPALAAGGELSANNDGDGFNARRMLAVLQFCEDDDMAFVLDRMFSRQSPMRARLATGRCFVRFVVIGDNVQRRSICGALNQWLISSGERASGIGAHFATSLEIATEDASGGGRTLLPAGPAVAQDQVRRTEPDPSLNSGGHGDVNRPQPLPSGF